MRCEDEPTGKRRKVRKGTRNCWECKRRKVRCIFALPTNATCDNCIQRRTACISQEYHNEPTSHGKEINDGTEARLSRVEELLEHVVKNVSDPRHSAHRSAGPIREPCPELVNLRGLEDSSQREDFVKHHSGESNGNFTLPSPEATLTPTSTLPSSDLPLSSRYTGLARELVAAWPSQHDLDRIYDLPICLSTHFHMKLCTSNSTLMTQLPLSPREMLQLPPPGSHPVMIARTLLLLGSLLQGALAASRILETMRDYYNGIMSRVVDTATRLVTTNDDITASIEGVECIMIEAMIQNYSGKLHRAWMTASRASAVAQMIGLHRGSKLPSIRISGSSLDPGQLCFRIVEMDCYLSITLGLPQPSLETYALAPEALNKCQPLDRMARLQYIIARRILEKKSHDIPEIDQLIQKAANEMPPQWWLTPNLTSSHDNAPDPFHLVARTMYQFSHYHLVLRLHLPYVLRSSADGRHDYSKMAAINASREILSRYIAFRVWNPGHFYCRGTDFLAFIALAVLCLAHIDSRNPLNGNKESSSIARILVLSHPSDRGLMESTFEILHHMENDAIAAKLARLMRHLLDVEADAADGVEYGAVATENDAGPAECGGEFFNSRDTLMLHIPYFGTINLQRGLVSAPTGTTTLLKHSGSTTNIVQPDIEMEQHQRPFSDLDAQWSQQPQSSWGDLDQMLDPTGNLDAPDDWTLQSINESLFSTLFNGIDDQDAFYNILPYSDP